jgi:tRNA wybutosine-synthesizing protein 3
MAPSLTSNPSAPAALPLSFISKKKNILEKLSIPFGEYDDLSPKGSIDEGIRELIDKINSLPGYVTTSSCSGRISIFLEGPKASTTAPLDPEPEEAESNEREDLGRDSDTSSIENERQAKEQVASTGGKGGGKWMFVCHDPINYASDSGEVDWIEQFDMVPILEDQKMSEEEMWGLRLIHFKFEPMVLSILFSHVPCLGQVADDI